MTYYHRKVVILRYRPLTQ